VEAYCGAGGAEVGMGGELPSIVWCGGILLALREFFEGIFFLSFSR